MRRQRLLGILWAVLLVSCARDNPGSDVRPDRSDVRPELPRRELGALDLRSADRARDLRRAEAATDLPLSQADGHPDSQAKDLDKDGYTVENGDCNDNNASIHPGAPDPCQDGIDQDCDGSDPCCCAVDVDKDGYGPDTGDCNDQDPAVHPGAKEVCGDGVDQNCDGKDTVCAPSDGGQSPKA